MKKLIQLLSIATLALAFALPANAGLMDKAKKMAKDKKMHARMNKKTAKNCKTIEEGKKKNIKTLRKKLGKKKYKKLRKVCAKYKSLTSKDGKKNSKIEEAKKKQAEAKAKAEEAKKQAEALKNKKFKSPF